MCYETKLQHVIDFLKQKAITSPLNYKHSACLIHRNKVQCYGINKYMQTRTTNGYRLNMSVHAEIDALMSFKYKNVKGLDLIIIRVCKTKEENIHLRNSRPCNACIDKLRQCGVRKVYYSGINGEILCEYAESMPKTHESSGSKYRQRLTMRQL